MSLHGNRAVRQRCVSTKSDKYRALCVRDESKFGDYLFLTCRQVFVETRRLYNQPAECLYGSKCKIKHEHERNARKGIKAIPILGTNYIYIGNADVINKVLLLII